MDVTHLGRVRTRLIPRRPLAPSFTRAAAIVIGSPPMHAHDARLHAPPPLSVSPHLALMQDSATP
jgi:hypothetical protein